MWTPMTTKILTAAGLAGFLGYSIYFDWKRRSAHDYKKKIRERRKLNQKNKLSNNLQVEFPNPTDRASLEKFLFDELTIGEKLMNNGSLEEGAYHLSNAIIISEHPNELLNIFQQTVPTHHFSFIIQALPSAKARLEKSIENSKIEDKKKITFVDDDLE